MKRIFTFIGCLTLAATMQTKAQSQRLVLVEEFTNASCPPCAAQNPTFNTLLANNTVKVVSIKYQTNWPGVDPMNAQTQAEVGPRVTYYGVTGVPYSPIDGDVNIAAIGGYYQGGHLTTLYNQPLIQSTQFLQHTILCLLMHILPTSIQFMLP